MTGTTRTAFRVYGRFAWPPVGPARAGDPPPPSPSPDQDGIVELLYHAADDQPERPYLRWLPRALVEDGDVPAPVSDAPNLARLDRAALVAHFADPTVPIAVVLDADPGAIATAPGLVFAGAALVEEWASSRLGQAPDPAAIPATTRGWPLARSFRSAGRPQLCSVRVGREGNESGAKDDPAATGSSVTLQLALATPWAQSGSGRRLAYALPFRVRYEPGRFVGADRWNGLPLPVSRVVGGTRGAKTDTEGVSPPDLFAAHRAFAIGEEWDDDREVLNPARWRLGCFGIGRTDAGAAGLHLPRSEGNARGYWPSDGAQAVEDVFGGLLTYPRDLGDHVALWPASPWFGEEWNCLWFDDPDKDDRAGVCTVVHRCCFALTAGDAYRGGAGRDLQVVGASSFELAVPGTGAAPIRMRGSDGTLLVEARVTYDIDAPWRHVDVVAGPPGAPGIDVDVELALGLLDGVKLASGSDIGADEPPQSISALLTHATIALRTARAEVAHAQPSNPVSLLPEFTVEEGQAARFAVRVAFAGRLERRGGTGPGAGEVWLHRADAPRSDASGTKSSAWLNHGALLSLWPDRDNLGVDTDPDRPPTRGDSARKTFATARLKATMALSGFADGKAPISVVLAADPGIKAKERTLRAGFRLEGVAPLGSSASLPPPIVGRLGGLRITASRRALHAKRESHWRFSPLLPQWVGTPRTGARFWPADTAVRLSLEVVQVLPVQVAGRAPPLLLPMMDIDAAGTAEFVLGVDETIGGAGDRSLIARLYDREQGDAARTPYIVLSEQPFGFARIQPSPLEARGSIENALVAEYRGGVWQFRRFDEVQRVSFPAQAVGESMSKPRRFAIVDAPPPVPGAVPRPWSDGEQPGLPSRHAVECRFTPSADLWVRPGDLGEAFGLPEWQLRELWTRPGALGTGAALAALRGEFLYGMPVGIDIARERGAARTARVAEIAALLGEPSACPPGSAPEHALGNALARRPERLELWMRDAEQPQARSPARFGAGVRHALRTTARHYPALENLGERPWDGRIADYGLPGGALGPIESLNFLRQLLDTSTATGGTIENVALSPTGGDADQRAEFLDGRLAIITETRNGFVQRHRVEILGRIAVFWHRAKHVVVYERTTNSAAQFPWEAPTEGGAVEEGSRRPIIRKVAEFIELLQPERLYPDAPGVDARTAGFLDAVRFNQKTINVDSAWSEDIGTAAWRIPLWNRGFAHVSPQVYPRPDVAFVTAAEGEGQRPQIAQECLDPDNLFFYAEVAPPSPDSDLWPARQGIDFSPVTRPQPAHQRGHAVGDPDPGETRQVSAPRVPRGQRRFTWHLAPANRRTAINAGRGREPVYAALETLTFSRATEAPETATAAADALAAAAGFAPVTVPAMAELARIDELDPDGLKGFAERLRADLGTAAKTLSGIEDAIKLPKAPLQTLQGLFGSGDPCGKLRQDLARSLQGRRLLVIDGLRGWLADPAAGLGADDWKEVVAAATRDALVDAVIAAADKAIRRALEPGLHQAPADVGGLARSLASARALVADYERDLRRRLRRCADELDAVQHSYDAGKPWSPARLARIEQQITAARDGLVADLGRAVEDAGSRLATDLGLAGKWIGAPARAALARVNADLARRLADAGGGVRGFATHWRGRLDALAASVRQMEAALDEAAADHPDQQAEIDRVRQAVRAIDAATDAARDALGRAERGFAEGSVAVGAIVGELQTALGDLIRAADAAAAALKTALDDVREDVRQGLAAATDTLVEASDALLGEGRRLAEEAGKSADDAARLWFAQARAALADVTGRIDGALGPVLRAIDDGGGEAAKALGAIADATTSDKLLDLIRDKAVAPAIRAIVGRLDWAAASDHAEAARRLLGDGLHEVDGYFDALLSTAGDILTGIDQLCEDLGDGLADARQAALDALAPELARLREGVRQLDALIAAGAASAAAIKDIADTVDAARAEIDGAVHEAQAYADRVFDAAGDLAKGGLGAAPGRILILWAAAASAPALPNLDVARERLGYYYDAARNLIDTTPAAAWFGRLGDELKALGLTLPFAGIEDRLVPASLKDFDVGRIFRNFGGLDLSGLFKGIKLPADAAEAIKVTHAFDRKALRAWVQIDVDVPMPGRKPLFAIGPFALDFVDARLEATVRLEASRDSDEVAQTGSARLTTDADASVGGQSMVTVRRLVIRYDRDGGLDVDVDPKNIRINPSLRFIQDTLAAIVPDQAGGLKIVKERGVPVGVEHEFAMPPLSLMAGTSGVSNLQIANRFALVAYPDFRIANRFALCSPELPFLFSIFIIGGTGYLIAESDYRPLRNELAVRVEAAAGGSAALGFSAGPISGSVFVSLSIAIAYRKPATGTGGGLTVSVVLLIAGNVDVAGIASVHIGLLLRMAYRDDGAIDGQGDLHIRIRLSRFFTYSVRQSVERRLRGPTRGGSPALVPPAPPAQSRGAAIIGARG